MAFFAKIKLHNQITKMTAEIPKQAQIQKSGTMNHLLALATESPMPKIDMTMNIHIFTPP